MHGTSIKAAFLTVKEVAAILRVRDQAVYPLAQTKDGPPMRRLKRRIRFPRKKFLRWAGLDDETAST